MKKIIPLIAILATGCLTQQPVTTLEAKNNADYKVSYLFEYGGCKVYRFNDIGNTVYFTNCGSDTVAIGDSTQVRSTGMNKKQVDISSYNWKMDTFYNRNKPVNISSFKQDR